MVIRDDLDLQETSQPTPKQSRSYMSGKFRFSFAMQCGHPPRTKALTAKFLPSRIRGNSRSKCTAVPPYDPSHAIHPRDAREKLDSEARAAGELRSEGCRRPGCRCRSSQTDGGQTFENEEHHDDHGLHELLVELDPNLDFRPPVKFPPRPRLRLLDCEYS